MQKAKWPTTLLTVSPCFRGGFSAAIGSGNAILSQRKLVGLHLLNHGCDALFGNLIAVQDFRMKGKNERPQCEKLGQQKMGLGGRCR